ncbi:hypothetical protein GGF46_004416 [Coemansia sp. RSA 552]|nr:hypothetical protein GGF46_004416 [Coemansia sp. RSA 552]
MSYLGNLKERLRRPGGPPFYFRIANLVVAVLMIVSAIVFFTWAEFGRIMLGIYEIMFGLWMIMLELAEMKWLVPYVQFMLTWRGRGIFYVFMGCLTLGHNTFGWVVGAVITGIGVAYIVLSFTAKRDESYTGDTAGGQPTTGDIMYNPSQSNGQKSGMYWQGADTYGSVLSVHQGTIQSQSQPQPQPQYTTTQYTTTQYASPHQTTSQPSRDSAKQPLFLALAVLNIALGALVFTQGCLSIRAGSLRHVMLGVVCLFIGLFVVLAELVHIGGLRMFASFLFSFCGRGLFYLLIGCITLDTAPAELGIGLVLIVVGVVYLALALIPRCRFDNPEDQYAMVIHNIQNGAYTSGPQRPMGAAAPVAGGAKTALTMDSYLPQGISSSTFDISASQFGPNGFAGRPGVARSQHRADSFSEKPPRI